MTQNETSDQPFRRLDIKELRRIAADHDLILRKNASRASIINAIVTAGYADELPAEPEPPADTPTGVGAGELLEQIHPAALLVPEMSDDEFELLVADIERNGQNEPVVVDAAGQLLDGRHRARACAQLGIEPVLTVYEGDDPVGYVVSRNLVRRNLSVSRRACAGLLVLDEMDRGPRGPRAGRRRDQAALMVGASGRSIQRASEIRAANPELFNQALLGHLTLGEAERRIKSSAPPPPPPEDTTIEEPEATNPPETPGTDTSTPRRPGAPDAPSAPTSLPGQRGDQTPQVYDTLIAAIISDFIEHFELHDRADEVHDVAARAAARTKAA